MKRIVFDVPKWNVLQERMERGLESPDDRDRPRMRFEDEVFDRLYSGEVDLLPAEKVDAQLGPWALGFHEQAEQMPRYQRLADEVRGDVFAAAAATDEIVKAIDPPDPLEPEEGFPDPTPPIAPPDPVTLRRAITAGVLQANAAVAEAREAAEGLEGVSIGTGAGKTSGTSNVQRVREIVQAVRNNYRLKQIAEKAGRFKRIAAQKRRSRVRHGQDELQDIEQGGELARLIPAELAKLASPKLKLAIMRDVLERKALQYRIEGQETMGKGPIVVCIDKSGSMNGEKDSWASAIALALLQRAQVEKRMFALVCFDHGIRYKATVKPGEELPEAGLLVDANGGTDIDRAMDEALSIIRDSPGQMRKADIVLITDGVSVCDTAETLANARRTLGVTSIGFGVSTLKESLLPWCDEVFGVEDLNKIGDGAAEALFARE